MSVQREISGTELVKRRLSSRNFVSYRKFKEISFFVPRKFRSKGLELSLELSRELSWKVRVNKERNSRISLALLLHNTVIIQRRAIFQWVYRHNSPQLIDQSDHVH